MANTESLTSIPERRANLCSRLLFTWYTPLTSVQINTASDVWKTPKEDSSLVQTTLLEERLEYQKKLNTSPQRQLLFALVRTRGWEWLLCSFLKLTGMYSNIFNLSFSHPLFAVCVCALLCSLSFPQSFVCSFIRLFVHSSMFSLSFFVLRSFYSTLLLPPLLYSYTGETAQYVLPVLLNLLISWLEEPAATRQPVTYPLTLSGILLGTMIFRTFVMAYYVNLTCRVGLTRKTAFMGVVLHKIMRELQSIFIVNNCCKM